MESNSKSSVFKWGFIIEYSSRDNLMPYMVLTINAINKYIDFFFSRRIKCKLQQVPIFKTFLYSSYWEHTLYISNCSFNSFKFENLWKKEKRKEKSNILPFSHPST